MIDWDDDDYLDCFSLDLEDCFNNIDHNVKPEDTLSETHDCSPVNIGMMRRILVCKTCGVDMVETDVTTWL